MEGWSQRANRIEQLSISLSGIGIVHSNLRLTVPRLRDSLIISLSFRKIMSLTNNDILSFKFNHVCCC